VIALGEQTRRTAIEVIQSEILSFVTGAFGALVTNAFHYSPTSKYLKFHNCMLALNYVEP